MKFKFGLLLALAGALAFAFAGASAGAHPAAGPHTCSGTSTSPGVLKGGTYKNGVTVKGVCEVNKGAAHVIGTVTVTQNGALLAAFGMHHSKLSVKGDVVIDKGGMLDLGCKATPEDACIDDPNPSAPTLKSHGTVSGSITENKPLGVIVHNGTIGHDITETGGGGGLSCAPTGIFTEFSSPPFSDYEDSTIGGSITVTGMHGCWLGLARDTISGTTKINKNDMGDPDAIEILANKIDKNLTCKRNSHPSGMPPGTFPTWDTAENAAPPAIYPRISEPNKVGGKRSGQCVTASPIALGGPPAAKHF